MVLPIVISTSVLLLGALLVSHQRYVVYCGNVPAERDAAEMLLLCSTESFWGKPGIIFIIYLMDCMKGSGASGVQHRELKWACYPAQVGRCPLGFGVLATGC